MKKRKIGERAIILFDSIDIEILDQLNSSKDGISVLQLADRLSLRHNSLKPHLDKLRQIGVIFAYRNQEGKILLYTGMENVNQLDRGDFDTDKEYEEVVQEAQKQRDLLNYLRKVRNLSYEKEISKAIDMDFRKVKEGRTEVFLTTLGEAADQMVKSVTSRSKEKNK